MNDFFISYIAFMGLRPIGLGEYIVYCSCGLEGIRQAVLDSYNTRAKHDGNVEADNIVITSLTILDPLTAVQLSDNYENVLRIEDEGNSAKE